MRFETLAAALETAEKNAATDGLTLNADRWTYQQSRVCYGGMAYDTARTLHVEIDRKNGRFTSKMFQVVLNRDDSGRYEVLTYAM